MLPSEDSELGQLLRQIDELEARVSVEQQHVLELRDQFLEVDTSRRRAYYQVRRDDEELERLDVERTRLGEEQERQERVLKPILRELNGRQTEFARRYADWLRLAAMVEEAKRLGGG